MLVLLLLSGLVALTALPVWITATAASPVAEEVDVVVRGTAAAPGLVAAALVLLAAAAALGLVGRVGRWVVVVVVAAGGALVVASALAARSGATATAERAAAEATGVPSLTAGPEVAAWPLVSAALGVLVLVAAVGLARASGRWAAPSDRHERASGPRARPTADAAAGRAAGPATAPDAPTGRPAHPVTPDPSDERGTWDALTRGDDPT
ncbi:Trp biosynthesis-associated membrane protein [Cellulomonas hominis]|uniref:Trp biosynthesis-associated membrane protein n=1 Tax=Cellulomonas hominis TaxID=156981 RepID=UPI0020C14B12|nr:Trp biosynthesis-associated membrane protein [Cellulomonas hominis]